MCELPESWGQAPAHTEHRVTLAEILALSISLKVSQKAEVLGLSDVNSAPGHFQVHTLNLLSRIVSCVLISRFLLRVRGRGWDSLQKIGITGVVFNTGWPNLQLKKVILNRGEILILKVFQGQKNLINTS